jgi:hypothetical protein
MHEIWLRYTELWYKAVLYFRKEKFLRIQTATVKYAKLRPLQMFKREDCNMISV